MNPLTFKELSKHPYVLSSLAASALLALIGGIYYVRASSVPQVNIGVSAGSTTITASGIVEPAQSPNLAFQSGGRVASLRATGGARVYRGQVLATLDLTQLSADRARAVASLSAQEAQLAQLKAGARDVDVAVKQTALDQANVSLNNAYASIVTGMQQARDRAYSNVTTYTDPLFNQPNTQFPTLAFITNSNQLSTDSVDKRVAGMTMLTAWSNELNSLSTDRTAVEGMLHSSISRLGTLRDYANTLLSALASAVSSTSFNQAQILSAQTSVNTARDAINAQISALQALDQQLSAAKLSVQSAQNALNQTNAGATKESVMAQEAQVASARAQVASVDAQIHNASVVAPFSGTVSAVHKKIGEIVTAGDPIVSLNPDSSLQITIYLNEIDIAKVTQGENADVTLDAYGEDRHFAANVITVDRSPSTHNGVQGYRVVLQFEKIEQDISSGMTANITINNDQNK